MSALAHTDEVRMLARELAANMMLASMKDRTYLVETAIGPDINEYIEWKKLANAADKTVDQYERDIKRMADLYPTVPLLGFDSTQLVQVLTSFPERSRRRAHSALRDFWKYAVAWNRLPHNPMDLVPRPKAIPAQVHDIFTEAEEERLIMDGPNRDYGDAVRVRDKLGILILLRTGVRAGEIRNILVEHVNLADQLMIVHGKGSRSRVIPLRGPVLQAMSEFMLTEIPRLGRAPRDGDHVLYVTRVTGRNGIVPMRVLGAYPHKLMGYSTFWRWWDGCVNRAGIRYRKPHMTRHTLATKLSRSPDVKLEDVQAALGHQSIATTQTYLHNTQENVGRAFESMETERSDRTVPSG